MSVAHGLSHRLLLSLLSDTYLNRVFDIDLIVPFPFLFHAAESLPSHDLQALIDEACPPEKRAASVSYQRAARKLLLDMQKAVQGFQ